MRGGGGTAAEWSRRPAADRPTLWPLVLIVGGVLAGLASILWAFEDGDAQYTRLTGWASIACTGGAVGWLVSARYRDHWDQRRWLYVVGAFVLSLVAVGSAVPNGNGWVAALIAIVGYVATVGALGVQLRNESVGYDIAGVVTIVAAAVTGAWLIVAIASPADEDLWIQVVALFVGVGVSLVLVSLDWSRAGLYIAVILTAAVLLVYLTRVGYQAEVTAQYDKPFNAALLEFRRLAPPDEEPETTPATDTDTDTAEDGATVDAGDDQNAVRISQLELEVASYRYAVDPSDANRTALRDAAATLARAADDKVQPSPEEPPPSTAPVYLAIGNVCATAATDNIDLAGCRTLSARERSLAEAQLTEQATADDLDLAESESADTAPVADPDVGVRLAELELAVAGYRFALDPSDENKAALSNVSEQEPIDIAVVDAIAAAPGAVVDSLDPDRGTRLNPGPFGWFFLVAVAVALGRWMFKLNARQGPGPVSVGGDGDGAHLPHFSVALLANVEAPGATPGAIVSESLTGLTSVTPGAKGIADGIAAAINVILARKVGFVATCEVAPATKPDDKAAGAPDTDTDNAAAAAEANEPHPPVTLVRITRTATGRVVATKKYSNADVAEAARLGGTWAAGRILAESSRIPAWAQWNEANIGAVEELARTGGSALERSRRAARIAPTSGIALVRFQFELAAAGRHIDATIVAARAVAIYPRHLQARNFLALRLCTLVTEGTWKQASATQRRLVGETVRLACDRLAIDDPVPADGPARSDETTQNEEQQLTELARSLWTSIVVDVRPWRRMAAALRRPDRTSAWVGWRLGRTNSSALSRTIASTAALVDESDDVTNDKARRIRRYVSWAHRDQRSYIVAYNLACAAAQRNAVDYALLWLHRTQLHDDARHLTPDAVATDPDLSSIRNHPRFRAFLEELGTNEED